MTEPKYLYMPQEVGTITSGEVDRRRKPENQAGVKFPLDKVASYLNPLEAGDLTIICGLASNAKSLVARWWLRKAVETNTNPDKLGVFVSYEQYLEQQGMIDLAELCGISTTAMYRGEISDDEMKRIKQASIKRGQIASGFVGHSTTRKMGKGRVLPTIDQVDDALMRLVNEQGKWPLVIVIDYLQRIPIGRGDSPTLEYSANVDACKDLGLKFNCPVILLVQAREEVRQRKWKLPRMGDGQWTSNSHQSADNFIGVWMPKTTEPLDSILPTEYTDKHQIMVDESLLIFGLDKQKYGPAPRTSFLTADPAHGLIYEKNLQDINDVMNDRWHK